MGLVRAVRCSILLWVALAAGCAARAEPAGAAAPPRSEAPEAPGTPVSEGTAKAPAGFVELTVGGVIEAEGDHAVVLIDRARETVVPIGIGGSEALSIHLRHNKRRYPRPLTHDLLDEVLRQLGGRVVKVHIEDMRGNTFIGTVFVVRRGRVMAIDARPSDAIALALGSGAPIFVSKDVVVKAGIRKQDIAPPASGSAPPPI
jgi:bifunctional DNase/RNase